MWVGGRERRERELNVLVYHVMMMNYANRVHNNMFC